MKQGGDRKRVSGFTIVEVMIVLAVTGVLFVAAAIMINGRQNKTQFQTATNSFLQQLQQISNETASGYTESSSVTCTAGTPPTLTSGASALGSNGGCIFIGKVLQLGLGSVPDNQKMQVFPVVGNRLYNTQAVTSLSQAYPVALSPTQGGAALSLESGLWLDSADSGKQMSYVPAGITNPDSYPNPLPTRGLGFMSGLGDIATSGGDPAGGSTQQLQLYAVANTDQMTTTTAQMKDKIDATSSRPGGGLVKAAQVRICLNSGGTNQSVRYLIGGDNNNPVGVRMTIYYAKGCV